MEIVFEAQCFGALGAHLLCRRRQQHEKRDVTSSRSRRLSRSDSGLCMMLQTALSNQKREQNQRGCRCQFAVLQLFFWHVCPRLCDLTIVVAVFACSPVI